MKENRTYRDEEDEWVLQVGLGLGTIICVAIIGVVLLIRRFL